MSYIVFARKYRPKAFDEIVGQPHITTTLKNAISQDRVAHAYLFAGPRGVGKTTAARILAKALNCEKGPSPEPCNTCNSCKEIALGSSLDILEIDGASNRGIDEIRNLRDSIKFAPSRGKFKVYIIDEVHMLTPEAFNALLKTLEEPPPHVKFIFATTQAYKVPATILSRCQRFDFRRIVTKDIITNLNKIAKAEGLDVSDEALGLIARYSDGGMRNGQVILDQISSFAKGKVGADDVAKILGVVDDEILFELSDAVKDKDAAKALSVINRLVNEGKDINQVVLGLIGHFRNMLVAKVGSNQELLIDAGAEKIKRYMEVSGKSTAEEILYIIYTLSNTIDLMRKSGLARIPLEAAMIKLTKTGSIISLDEILKKLDMLEAPASIPTQASVQIHNVKQKPVVEAVEVNTSASKDVEEILSSWVKVIDYIRNKKISIASYLQEGYPTSLEGRALTIGFPKELKFHKEVLESQDNKRLIEEALNKVLGLDLKAVLTLVEPINIKRPQSSGSEENLDGYPSETGEPSKDQVDPIVKAALEMFGGSIAKVRSNKEKIR